MTNPPPIRAAARATSPATCTPVSASEPELPLLPELDEDPEESEGVEVPGSSGGVEVVDGVVEVPGSPGVVGVVGGVFGGVDVPGVVGGVFGGVAGGVVGGVFGGVVGGVDGGGVSPGLCDFATMTPSTGVES
ncbi:hypothetical protein [Corynebacterium sp. HMSC065H09]|uniref:hypothetical protein n=1 Tax=Corynebacterium sp. HMSC065H09 TaxID=1739382 RepID=UPI00352A445D